MAAIKFRILPAAISECAHPIARGAEIRGIYATPHRFRTVGKWRPGSISKRDIRGGPIPGFRRTYGYVRPAQTTDSDGTLSPSRSLAIAKLDSTYGRTGCEYDDSFALARFRAIAVF